MSKYQAVLLQINCGGSTSSLKQHHSRSLWQDWYASISLLNKYCTTHHPDSGAVSAFLLYCYYFNCFNSPVKFHYVPAHEGYGHCKAHLDSEYSRTVTPKALRRELLTPHPTAGG